MTNRRISVTFGSGGQPPQPPEYFCSKDRAGDALIGELA